MTEEQRTKMVEDRKAYEEAVKAEVERRRVVIAEMAVTPQGKKFLRLLHGLCGFDKADRVIRSDGQVDPVATALNAERRLVYLEVRRSVPVDVLREIEFMEEKK